MQRIAFVQSVVAECNFPGYTFEVAYMGYNFSADVIALRVTYNEPDVMTGVTELQEGRWWLVQEAWDKGQIARTAFKAIMTSLEHRCRENFKYRGKAVFNPHFDIDDVWSRMEEHAVEMPAIDFQVGP